MARLGPVTDRDAEKITWFGHAGSLDRDSQTVRFYGESGKQDAARTINVAVSWAALEALEGQQTEVRDRLRYTRIFEDHRARFEAIAERKVAQDAPLSGGYLLIGPEDL